MADRVVPGAVESSACIREAVCINTNKIFDSYEKELIRDVIASRFPLKLHNTEVFE